MSKQIHIYLGAKTKDAPAATEEQQKGLLRDLKSAIMDAERKAESFGAKCSGNAKDACKSAEEHLKAARQAVHSAQ